MRTKESKNDKRTKLPNGIVIDIYGFLVSMDLSFLMIKQFFFVMGGVCDVLFFMAWKLKEVLTA